MGEYMYRTMGKKIKRAFMKDSVLEVLHSYVQAGPFDGGCLIVAKALLHYMPECEIGSLVRGDVHIKIGFGSRTLNIPIGKVDECTDHFVLLTPDSGILDGEGYFRDVKRYINRFYENFGMDTPYNAYIARGIYRPQDSYDNPSAVKALVLALKPYLLD